MPSTRGAEGTDAAEARAEARKSRIASDKALLTEEHDEIMRWLNDHMYEILSSMKFRLHWDELQRDLVIGAPPPAELLRDLTRKAEQHVKRLRAEVERRQAEGGRVSEKEHRFRQQVKSWRGLGRPPKQELFEIIETVWQEPVVLDRSHTAYMDMKVTLRAYALTVAGLDQEAIPTWQWASKDVTFWVEVEPEIVSIGGLIRRLRQYEEALEGGSIMVVSNDASCARVFREQGYFFLPYNPDRF